MTLSALANRIRRDRPNASDAEVRLELLEAIRQGIADNDPAFVDLLHNIVVERLLSDGVNEADWG